MVSYCSLSNDRLLTKILIENSNNILLSKCVHDFVNKCQWIDGLDIWSSSLNNKTNDILKTNLDFDKDIGLYLPRYYQFNSITLNNKNNLKQINKDKISQSLQKLIQREDNQFSSLNNQTTNIIQKQNSNENVLLTRQSESRNSFENKKCKDKIEYLLKEELTNLFRRESTNICSKRSFRRIPSVDIKHNNLLKSNSSIDSTLIMERYTKLKQLLINPSINQSKINSKSNQLRQSPLIFQPLSTFGLTVTPLDFSSSKQLQNSSQQKETINRPVTQPGFISSSTEKLDQEQRIFIKRNNDIDFISSYTDLTISNKNLNDEQIQTIKRSYRHQRFLSKSTIQRSKTMQLLPHIAGTKIHVTISNQRNS